MCVFFNCKFIASASALVKIPRCILLSESSTVRAQLADPQPSTTSTRATHKVFDGIKAEVLVNVVEFIKLGGAVDFAPQSTSELYHAANLLGVNALKVGNLF